MTVKEMWSSYLQENPDAANEIYEVWHYGSQPDKLAQLTVDGIKTATASAYDLYQAGGEPLPQAGEYSVIIRSDCSAACVIRTTDVLILRFRDVPADFAWKEGEGDRSLEYWRKVHEKFFTDELKQIHMPFTEDIKVVCEEFKVVFK